MNLKLKCLRCGHEWLRRDLDKLPESCPRKACHSPYWNTPRKRTDQPSAKSTQGKEKRA